MRRPLEDCLHEGTIGDLEREGALYLSPSDIRDPITQEEELQVVMPFALLKNLNSTLLPSPVFPPELLKSPTAWSSWNWEDFELLHAHFLVVLLDSLMLIAETRKRLFETKLDFHRTDSQANPDDREKQPIRYRGTLNSVNQQASEGWRLGAVFRGARAPQALLDLRVRLRPLKVYRESEKLLATLSDTAEPAIDPRTGEATVNCIDVGVKRLSEGVFRCAPNTALFDHRLSFDSSDGRTKYAVFIQDKFSSPSSDPRSATIFEHELSDWYRQARAAVAKFQPHYEPLFLIFTTRACSRNISVDNFSNLMIIDHTPSDDSSPLERHLTRTFSHRGLVPSPPISPPLQIASPPPKHS